MKKRIMATLLAGIMVFAVGCNNTEGSVTLGEYKGLTLTSVSQATVDAEVSSILESYAELVEVDRFAQEGDTVNINYVGTLDGVAFEGGTDDSEEGTDLELGSNMFIDGFEEGLISAVAGEQRELNLTFPDPYDNNPDLAGKDVVFTVTVNSVKEEVIHELTDEFIAENMDGYTNTEEFLQSVRDGLNEESYYSQIVELIMASSEVTKYPKDEIEEEREGMISMYLAYAEYYGSYFGLTTEESLSYFLGIESMDKLEQMAEEYAYEVTKNKMILNEIAKVEGLEVTEEEYTTRGLEYAVDYGFEDVDTFTQQLGTEELDSLLIKDLGENTDITEEEYNEKAAKYASKKGYKDATEFAKQLGREGLEKVLLLDIVMDFLLEQAIIVDAE